MCKKCNLEKLESEFHKKLNGLQPSCKQCKSAYEKERYRANRIHILQSVKAYRDSIPVIIASRKEDWKQKNIDKWTLYQREYRRNRRNIDIQFKLLCNLRTRLSNVLRYQHKSGSAIKDLGCSPEYLIKHLESKFQSGMTWENYGQWEIDHIRPLASFDLTDRNQLLAACNYANLQPLWMRDNRQKSDK